MTSVDRAVGATTVAPSTTTTGLLQAGTLRINGTSIVASSSADDTASDATATSSTKAASAIAIAAAINKSTATTGVTATAAPNDFWELGTSSEALGLLGFRDMITTFFKQETGKDHLGWGRTKYRFRGHAQEPFWAWVCSWARSLRKPSDLGFCDDGFELPPLIEKEYVVETAECRDGMLFAMPGASLHEERAERRNSIAERCEKASGIALGHDGPTVCWCELNDEGDQLEKMIPGSKQIKGSMSDEQKEEYLTAFSSGELRHLITKPKIGAWGLNWQHCCNVVSFPSHSYEQYYQAVRRCYRFGQKNPVNVSIIVGEGEAGILENLRRKAAQSAILFESIVAHMKDAMHLQTQDFFPDSEVLPSWL